MSRIARRPSCNASQCVAVKRGAQHYCGQWDRGPITQRLGIGTTAKVKGAVVELEGLRPTQADGRWEGGRRKRYMIHMQVA
jgi:hypothetical protein